MTDRDLVIAVAKQIQILSYGIGGGVEEFARGRFGDGNFGSLLGAMLVTLAALAAIVRVSHADLPDGTEALLAMLRNRISD